MIKITASLKGVDRLDAAVQNLGSLMWEGVPRAADEAARGFIRRVIAVTPPASVAIVKGESVYSGGTDARRVGENRIDKELRRVFVPVQLKGKRPEKYPDVRGLYDELVRPRKGRRLSTEPLGYRFHVDEAKFNQLRSSLIGHVGLLASGWNAAAAELDVPVPAWIARHGNANGSIYVEVEEHRIRIVMVNAISYSGDVDGYDRRTQAALNYQADAFVREVEFLREKKLSEVGLR